VKSPPPPVAGDYQRAQRSEIGILAWRQPKPRDQSLIAVLAGLQIPFLCTETHELGAEIVASYLYQIHLYHWLESNGYGRALADGDL
jgi:hypothetical protein